MTGLRKLHMDDYWDADTGGYLPNPLLFIIPFLSGFGVWERAASPPAGPTLLFTPYPCTSQILAWKAEQQKWEILTETPSREFRSRVLFPGQGLGGRLLPELREPAGSSPSLMAEESQGQRVGTGGSTAAKKEQLRLGESPGGEQEQAGCHGADPNPPTVPREQTAPRGQRCRARLLPKGNKQTVPSPHHQGWDSATIPRGSGHW